MSVSVALSKTPTSHAARSQIRASASYGVPVYIPAYAGINFNLVTGARGCKCRPALGRGLNCLPLDRPRCPTSVSPWCMVYWI